MGIADFFRPKHRHSDVKVRTEAVRALTHDDTAILLQVAKTDHDIGVRRIAISKIEKADVLAELAQNETERSLREYLEERANELFVSKACGEDNDAATTALNGIVKLGDQRALVEVVVRAAIPAIRKRAFGELRDPRALAELAKREAPQEMRTAAVARIDDGDVLRALAIDTSTKEVGLAAVEKLDDVDRLENVAQKAKHKAVRQKARKIVTEIQEAEKASKVSTVPDDVKRRRAERSQLLREIEGVVDTFDFAKHADTVSRAEAAWAQLGTGEDDERFAKAVKRFWKRKEVHDSQARSADELRAQAKEAERQRAEAEKARAAAAAAVAPVEPVVEDPEVVAKRAAEEAERHAAREARRLEDEARRAAQAEERARKDKEAAERSVAIEASLTALISDMEALAEKKDTKGPEGGDPASAARGAGGARGIDKALDQASRAFESIGKILGPKRDELAERYRAARGKLVTKQAEAREAEDWERWSNVPKAEALIATAKEMQTEEPSPELGNRLKGLQALWKEVGALPTRRSKELWELFKAECDKVYDLVKGVRAIEAEKFAEVAAGKEQLISEAEALAESTDWAATAARLKELQAAWKDSGHLPRKQGDELWKRFRAACDKFFERRKPLLDAQFDEQARNLQAKQALIARAQSVANAASAESGWGKAIGQIKDLQAEWKEIGFVPRRDADAVYKAFRAACDAVFQKRDSARDSEANAHRAEIDAVSTEIDAIMAGGDDLVNRAIAVRAKAKELGAHTPKVEAMLRHLIANHADAIANTELDPTQLRSKREKLIGRAEELLPKQAEAVDTGAADIAARLKQAMSKNAFGSLRFSGRDPVEVVTELRAEWAEGGPILDDTDKAQAERFESTLKRVLDAAGVPERASSGDRTDRGERDAADRDGRRKRRDRNSAQQNLTLDGGTTAGSAAEGRRGVIDDASGPAAALAAVVATPASIPAPSNTTVVPDAASSAVAEIAGPEESTATGLPVVMSAHDAVTRPSHLPPEVPIGMTTLPEPPRRASSTSLPPMEEVDGGWDDEDPSAAPASTSEKTETPSSQEMASDGGVVGDGLDDVD